MAADNQTIAFEINSLKENPLVLSGPPGNIRGKLRVKNLESGQITLPDSQLRVLDQPKGRSKKRNVVHQAGLKRMTVRPGREKRVPLKLALDPQTPPGIYEAELEVNGQISPLTIQVLENLEVTLLPGRIVVLNQAGTTQTKTIWITNSGNVPFSIGEIGAVPLDDDLIICRVLRGTLNNLQEEGADPKPKRKAAADEKKEPLQIVADILEAAVDQAAGAFEKAGVLRVHNSSGLTVFNPGETKAITLEIKLPGSLDRRSRYRGVAALYTANLNFVVVPTTDLSAANG